MRIIEIEEAVDGSFMILINGFQYGGTYDASGAGNRTFASRAEAEEVIEQEVEEE